VVPSAAGAVVLVPFPFSNLAQSKFRPAIVLADAGSSDWVLCQVTSNAYADPRAVMIDASDFALGSLRIVSYARPGKLFTAHESLLASEVGVLTAAALTRVRDAVVQVLRP
jgi:mRNA interferase MazF